MKSEKEINCGISLTNFINELQTLEKISHRPKTQNLLGFLPQNTFARLIYVFLGGYDNPVFATLGTGIATHILFHYLTPRFVGRYLLAHSYVENDDWLEPGIIDTISTILWLVLILSHIKEKILEQETFVVVTQRLGLQRDDLLNKIATLLNDNELDQEIKDKALTNLKTMSTQYNITETDDHLIEIKYLAPTKMPFWERYNHLSPSIYYQVYRKTHDYLCDKARQIFNPSRTDTDTEKNENVSSYKIKNY
jgi:hypothetical protein